MEEVIGVKGFYQADLKIVNYHRKNIVKNSYICSNEENEGFFICYVYEGKIDFNNSKGMHELKKNDMAICMPYENYKLFCPPEKTTKYCIIQFEQNVIGKINPSLSLLRAFVDRNKGENNIYRLGKDYNDTILTSLFETSKVYIQNNIDRSHYIALLHMILSEICVCFDINNTANIEKYSDEYEVRIYDYICRNSGTNITIDGVAKKFFVSRWYINKLCYKFYHLPFKEMIVDMRMWHARNIMRNSNVRLNKLYEICGYKDYSGFFKAYKKFFGVSPKNDYNNFKTTGEFLTK